MIELIDAFLADTRHQSLLDADKVRDFLLELRLLAAPVALTETERDLHFDWRNCTCGEGCQKCEYGAP